jgi:hypothetical protein
MYQFPRKHKKIIMHVAEFLELQKQIYLDMFTHSKAIFDDEEEEDDIEMDSTKKKPMETTNVVNKGEGKKVKQIGGGGYRNGQYKKEANGNYKCG